MNTVNFVDFVKEIAARCYITLWGKQSAIKISRKQQNSLDTYLWNLKVRNNQKNVDAWIRNLILSQRMQVL